MDDQLDCLILQDPHLPLHVIWDLVCKMPMRDRCALLATCKKALSTFGGLTTRMARLRLTMCEKPRQTRQAAAPSAQQLRLQGGDPSSALEILPPWRSGMQAPPAQQQLLQRGDPGQALAILSRFPNAVIRKLELQFVGMRDVAMYTPMRSFTAGAGAWLRHVTSLELNEFETPGQVSPPCRFYSCFH